MKGFGTRYRLGMDGRESGLSSVLLSLFCCFCGTAAD